MHNALKAARLDFALLAPYKKNLLMLALMPIIFVTANRSLSAGIAFAMSILAMTSSYTFSIAEKNGLDRLYGLLPLRKYELVWGKYLFMGAMGLIMLCFSLLAQTIALRLSGVSVLLPEIGLSALIGFSLFTFFVCSQLPGYFTYGVIRGRAFVYLPTIGAVFAMLLLSRWNLSVLWQHPALLGTLVLSILVLLLLGSLRISIRAMEKKD